MLLGPPLALGRWLAVLGEEQVQGAEKLLEQFWVARLDRVVDELGDLIDERRRCHS